MKIKNDQSGIAYVVTILVIVIISIIGYIGLKVWENTSNNSQAHNNGGSQTTVAKSDSDNTAVFACDNYSVNYPLKWNAWRQKIQNDNQISTSQCYISTWTKQNMPTQITKSYEDIAVIMNFSPVSNYSAKSGSIKEIITDYYSDSQNWEFKTTVKSIEDFQFKLGKGVKVVTEGGNSEGEHTTYYYIDDSQVVNLIQTQTTNSTSSRIATRIIKSLDKK